MTRSPAIWPALALLLLSACSQAPRTRADAASTAACRAEADRTYAAQNRRDLSQRDQRDTPYASSYLPGITTRDLGARFARDNQVQSCLNSSTRGGGQALDTGTGPTFSPAQQ